MTSQRLLKKAGVGGFRVKLLAAMMLVLFAITAAVLWLAQRNAEAAVERNLQNEFQSRLGFLLGSQETRRAAIAERCRMLAKSVRIRAALEENDVEDLYLNAKVELRDLLDDGRQQATDDTLSPRAKFFRFLNANGAVMPQPGSGSPSRPEPRESQLAIPGGVPRQQQIGYIATETRGSVTLQEVIATPIIATDTGEVLGAIVLGFKPAEIGGRAIGELESGIWLGGRLQMPAMPAASMAALSGEVTKAVSAPGGPGESLVVKVNGVPNLLFYKMLNPGSRFPPAYQVCLFSLAGSIARQQRLRWRIIGWGALILLAGLAASEFISRRLSAPVAKLAEDSAENLVQRERAEVALDLSRDELLVLNAELQEAVANLKATQQQVIQQERLRALGQMASGIAHDFNNALMPILGFCELLLLGPETLGDTQKTTHYLEIMQTAAKDAASIVGRLREFYRSHTDDEVLLPVNLKRLVEQTVTLTRPKWKDQAQANGVTVRIKLALDATPPVAGDESALREALTNLIFNAVDAMPAGGTLTLGARSEGESVVLEIADTGTGMSEDVRKRCLEPFFSTKGERGTGLGLSMVFGIVKRHGGMLDLRSEPGKGTTFIITLPQDQSASERVTAASDGGPAQRPLRILVVDDEPQVRDLLIASLGTDGHTVEAANHGVDGLQHFLAGKFDLVVTDKAMPGMSGDQMATAIKQMAPRTPIILLTGFGQFHDKKEFPDIDVLASKPITIPALRNAIATALEAA